jgi:hypothetical protein
MKKSLQTQSATSMYNDGEEELGDDNYMDCLDIEAALEKLRAPPPLTWQDFRGKFMLSSEGRNMHSLNENDVPEDEVVKLFGKVQSMKERSGYRISDVFVPNLLPTQHKCHTADGGKEVCSWNHLREDGEQSGLGEICYRNEPTATQTLQA